MPREALATKLAAASLFIENLRKVPDLLTRFEAVGRGADYVDGGRALYRRADRLALASRNAFAAKGAATDGVTRAMAQLRDRYGHHRRWARLAFEGDVAATEALGLKGRQPRRRDAWLDGVRQFYDHLLADDALVARLEALGLGRASLEEGPAGLAAVEAARRHQEQCRGQARAAREARDAALAALDAWLRENRALARLLLPGDQRLESVGIFVRS